MGLAVRHDAIPTNPVPDIGRIAGQPKEQPRALTSEERQEWIRRLPEDPEAVRRDQLGHSKVSMTQDNYLGRGLTDRCTAEALDIAVGDLA